MDELVSRAALNQISLEDRGKKLSVFLVSGNSIFFHSYPSIANILSVRKYPSWLLLMTIFRISDFVPE
jgi:hypothetical protein